MSSVELVAEELEFKLIVSKKGKHRPKSKPPPAFHQLLEKPECNERIEICQQTVITQLRSAESDLLQSQFFRECFENIQSVLVGVENVVCLGLGSFHECTIARYQLAFIRCLRNEAKLTVGTKFFDPVFNRAEIDILQTLGETVLEENLEGKYCADRKTLFFLPHCPKQIVNNLLWKNWHPKRLANVVLLCNSFSSVVNNNPERLLRNSAGYILRAVDLFQEKPVTNNFRFGDIFNDTSLHYLKEIEAIAPTVDWNCAEEPTYAAEDLELISKQVLEKLELN
uniref:SRR1-like domain-containing protein n=1 Tax=Anopheles farauti TaxID=69004 RepID=A0A182QY20_9DIPT